MLCISRLQNSTDGEDSDAPTSDVKNELTEEVAVSLAARLTKTEEDNFYLKQEVRFLAFQDADCVASILF